MTIAAFETGQPTEFAPEQGLRLIMPTETLLVWDGARAGLVGRSGPGYAGSTLARLTPVGVDPDYLFYFLNSRFEELNRSTKGAGIPHIDPSVLKKLPFPLAPLAEQRAIVERLDELLPSLQAGVEDLKAAQSRIGPSWAATLGDAMAGRLTRQWREERALQGQPLETGHQFLERLNEHQLGDPTSRTKDWSEGEPENDLTSLPQHWAASTLGACFRILGGATPSRRRPEYWGGDIPWVSSGEVRFNRIVKTRETISAAGLRNSSTQINPVGSVLLGIVGEGKTRGQVAILDVPAANNQNSAAIWVSQTDMPPEFVFFWLWSRYEHTRRLAVGNNQPALNRSMVARMPLPVPPLEEAREIVDLLSAARAQIEEIERATAHAIAQSSIQRSNILTAAFTGKLILHSADARLADGEAAAVLRERIRVEKARMEGEGRARPRRIGKKARVAGTLEEALADAKGWLTAQEAFRRCGVADGTETDRIEQLYRELNTLLRSDRLSVEPIRDSAGRKLSDRLKLRDGVVHAP
jgi:type I restriction enzyme S subunit